MPLLHDKGLSRFAKQIKTEKGKWYFGFICKDCGEKILPLENHEQIQEGRPVIGKGEFSVACYSCKKDEIIYKTSDLVPLQADKDCDPQVGFPRREPSNQPRQPLWKQYPKAKPTFGTSFLEERPECAVIIARCISGWSYIEHETALLLATILKINTEPAVAMFLAVSNSRTQVDMLNAVAETVLEEHDLELYGAVMNVRRLYERDRNALAHGIYGTSQLVENGIIWTEKSDYAEHTAKVWASDYQTLETGFKKEIFVYEAADLETIAENIEWMHAFMGSFRGYLSSSNASWRVERYHQLCAAPRIARELARMREKKKNPPARS